MTAGRLRVVYKADQCQAWHDKYECKQGRPALALWCNGSTRDFDSRRIGSNPVRVVRPAHYRIDERMRSMPRQKKSMQR